MTAMRVTRTVLHAHWGGGDLQLSGGKGARHPKVGYYRFEGDFSAAGLMVNVEVDSPWRFEETAREVEICLMHPDYDCPEAHEEASRNCKLVKRVVHAPRWTPVVCDVADGTFTIEIWAAPLAPKDGSKAVGETVLADAGFSVIATVLVLP